MLLPSETMLQNRYTVVHLIACGGMGAVYEAIDHRLKCRVALKQTIISADIPPKQANALRSAFEREAHLLARLRHPALVVVSDYFTEADGQFLVMQFITGDDLETLLERNGGPFAQVEVLRWADWLLDALDYLHSQHPPMVHRDIKPKNLKLTPRGEIVILDLGLAKSAVRDSTSTSSGIGVRGYTTQYAPLEQIQGGTTDPRSDLYALSATLYHLLTATPPPDALTRAAAALSGQPDPLRPANELNPEVNPSLAVILDQAMAYKIAQRFVSASAFRNALRLVQTQHMSLVIQGEAASAATDSSGQTTLPVEATGQTILQSVGEHEPVMLPGPAATPLTETSLEPPPTLIVCQQGQGHYRTINEALERIQPGARLMIRPGSYNESLVLDKPIEILGDGPRKDVIIESTDAPCILMQTDYALVRGLTLRGWAALNGNQYVAINIPQGRLVLEACDITSDTLACVAIHNIAANPLLWRCRIHDGKSVGILAYEHGQGVVEECEIEGHSYAGVLIKQGSNPIIRQCRIHHAERDGVVVEERAAGTIEGCDIAENARAGIAISGSSNPTIRLCRIHHQERGYGLYVHDKGEGTLEGCSVADNLAGVGLTQGGNTFIRRCRIHRNEQTGVAIWAHGAGVFEQCEVSNNAAPGFEISEQGNPTIRGCRINENGTVGVLVHEQGRGIIEQCDVTANAEGAWLISENSQVQREENIE